MTTILILGAGVMQMPGIRIARRKGWRVVLVDGSPKAVARDLADRFACVDLKDRDGLLTFARTVRGDSGLDGIFTAGTDFSSSVAWVAERLGLPGISFETAMRATDKCLMREAFDVHGVPSPRFVCWTGDGDPSSRLRPGMGYPLVVKPVDNMGARGVRRVQDPTELADACREAMVLSRSSRVIIEEYMEGPEFSLDAIVQGGAVTVCGVADRVIRFPPSFVEMGHTMPTSADPETVRALESVFRRGIAAIGIDNGAAKGDIKLTPKGPMVGEIAARLSGGYMSGWTFPLASGVEVTEAALNIAVGLPPGDLTPRRREVCAERALISIPGVVEDVAGEREAAGVAGVAEVFLRVAPGDTVVFPSNNVQKCGNVLAVGHSLDEAQAAASRALGMLQVRLRPLVAATSAHLLGPGGHPCFEELGPRLTADIAALPVYRGDPSTIEPGSPVQVEALPGSDDSAAKDWHGLGLPESVRRACERGNAVQVPASGGRGFLLSGMFWKSLVKGGHQGAVYVLDSLQEAARRGTVQEFLAGS